MQDRYLFVRVPRTSFSPHPRCSWCTRTVVQLLVVYPRLPHSPRAVNQANIGVLSAGPYRTHNLRPSATNASRPSSLSRTSRSSTSVPARCQASWKIHRGRSTSEFRRQIDTALLLLSLLLLLLLPVIPRGDLAALMVEAAAMVGDWTRRSRKVAWGAPGGGMTGTPPRGGWTSSRCVEA